MNRKLWRDLHRWAGLALVGLVGFYCLTGILLNHRQAFDYFTETRRSISAVPIADTAQLRAFLDSYKERIGRRDDPSVIRIKNGHTIEFLYGSHGKTTYVIDTVKGTMERREKVYQQPWTRLNDLHKALKTSKLWVAVADASALGILVLVATGVGILRWQAADRWLLGAGILVLVAAVFLG